MRSKTMKRMLSMLLIFTLLVSNFSSVLAMQVSATDGDVISVSEAIANNSGTATVEGYIVGTVSSSSNFTLDPPFSSKTNLALADSPEETDLSKMIPVQLTTSGINVRAALNLVDNPENYQAKVQITGSLEAYFSIPGLKSPSAYQIIEGGQAPEPTPEPELTTIAEARGMDLNRDVIVRGVVTADNSAIGGTQLSTYIQDETAGINLFAFSPAGFPDLKEGQLVEVRGSLAEFRGLLEVLPESIEILEENVALPEPTTLTLVDLQNPAIAEPLEGSLVKVSGYVQNVPSSPAGGGYNVSFVDSDFNSTTLRVMTGTNAIGELEVGKWYDVTAILSQYDSYQILPRKVSDIVLAEEQPEPPTAAGEYTATVMSVTDGDTIRLTSPVLGADRVRFLNIDTPETGMGSANGADGDNQNEHGDYATEFLQTLLQAGDEVTLKIGEEPTDAYGRLLAEVINEDGINTNLELVKNGYAVTYFIWPIGDEANYQVYQDAVLEAKNNELGIWNPANPLTQLPFEYRAILNGGDFHRYVGNSDTMEYVIPTEWSTVPVEKRIFFANEAEAEANGYTPAEDSGEEPTDPSEDLVSIQLLNLNDLHGKIDQTYNLTNDFGIAAAGRMDYVAAYLKEYEAMNPNTFIMHSGDMIGGSSPVAALFQDEPIVEMMNEIGFDIGTVGNHEFDEGTAELLRMVHGGDHPEGKGSEGYGGMDFPLVCANCVYKDSGETILPPYEIMEIAGEQIGFIGVNTTATLNMVIPDGIADITFTDETVAVNAAAEEITSQGVEAIVVLAHMAASQSGTTATGPAATLAQNAHEAVDIIFAAHNHQIVDAMVNDILIVQALDYGKAFAAVDIMIDPVTGDIVEKQAEIVFVDQSQIDPDPAVGAILSKYEELVAPILNEVIGHAAIDMIGDYSNDGDTPLGNLLADGMKWAMDSDFALMNGGGIRDNLSAGPITYNNLFNIQPFNNVLVKLEITGADLETILNAQISPGYGPDYSVAGFSYTWDRSTMKVVDIFLEDGTPIDKNATYTVTTNNFMASSTGAKYLPISQLGKNMIIGPEDLEATVAFVRSFDGPIAYESEGRIEEVEAAPPVDHGAVSIAEARSLENGSEVTVEGVVTSTPGVWGSRGFYIQDETAGIYVFQNAHDVEMGDVVRITAIRGQFNNEIQLSSPTNIEVLSQGATLPSANLLSPAELTKNYEGQLVKLEGVTISELEQVNNFGTFEFIATLENESALVRVDNRSGLAFSGFEFENGDVVDVVGVVAEFNGTMQLKPRMASDIVEHVTISYTTLEAVREGGTGQDVTVRAVVTTTSGGWGSKGFYMQDETAGIYVFQGSTDVKPGDVVVVTGRTSSYQGEFQLSNIETVEVVGKVVVPDAKEISIVSDIADAQGELLFVDEAEIIEIKSPDNFDNIEFILEKNGVEFTVRIDSQTSYKGSEFTHMYKVGDIVTVTGVGSYHSNRNILKLRHSHDIVLIERPETPTLPEIPADTKVIEADFSDVVEGTDVEVDFVDGEVERNAVFFTASQIAQLISKNAILVLQKEDVKISLPVSLFTGEEGVIFTIEEQTEEVVDGALSKVYRFEIKQGDTVLSHFEEPITLTFTLATPITEDASVEIRYFNGQEWISEDANGHVYGGDISEDGLFVTGTTRHFSTFAVFEVAAPEPSPEPNPGPSPEPNPEPTKPGDDEDDQDPPTVVTPEKPEQPGEGGEGKDNPEPPVSKEDKEKDGKGGKGTEKGKKDTNKHSDDKLPETATNSFTMIFIGFVVLLLGVFVTIVNVRTRIIK
ncbi:DUF6359 domain-containing protein [Evansella sp. AB-rgal1]|uniref:DUF6359 domain-containing protein n=1 Tax=Evansella sp. AB-rgal1 TaxID=3242696 RepID=UPI00359D29A7